MLINILLKMNYAILIVLFNLPLVLKVDSQVSDSSKKNFIAIRPVSLFVNEAGLYYERNITMNWICGIGSSYVYPTGFLEVPLQMFQLPLLYYKGIAASVWTKRFFEGTNIPSGLTNLYGGLLITAKYKYFENIWFTERDLLGRVDYLQSTLMSRYKTTVLLAAMVGKKLYSRFGDADIYLSLGVRVINIDYEDKAKLDNHRNYLVQEFTPEKGRMTFALPVITLGLLLGKKW